MGEKTSVVDNYGNSDAFQQEYALCDRHWCQRSTAYNLK